MKLLEDRILTDAKILGTGVLKVDMFLNHQLDVPFLDKLSKEFYRIFKEERIDKILTVEASGIAIAALTARYFSVPAVFAKKARPLTMGEDALTAPVYSFTKEISYDIHVQRAFLKPGERILILDDFLAHGNAAEGLSRIVNLAGGEVVGIGIVIEKSFQGGRKRLEAMGLKVHSLAIIEQIADGKVSFSPSDSNNKL